MRFSTVAFRFTILFLLSTSFFSVVLAGTHGGKDIPDDFFAAPPDPSGKTSYIDSLKPSRTSPTREESPSESSRSIVKDIENLSAEELEKVIKIDEETIRNKEGVPEETQKSNEEWLEQAKALLKTKQEKEYKEALQDFRKANSEEETNAAKAKMSGLAHRLENSWQQEAEKLEKKKKDGELSKKDKERLQELNANVKREFRPDFSKMTKSDLENYLKNNPANPNYSSDQRREKFGYDAYSGRDRDNFAAAEKALKSVTPDFSKMKKNEIEDYIKNNPANMTGTERKKKLGSDSYSQKDASNLDLAKQALGRVTPDANANSTGTSQVSPQVGPEKQPLQKLERIVDLADLEKQKSIKGAFEGAATKISEVVPILNPVAKLLGSVSGVTPAKVGAAVSDLVQKGIEGSLHKVNKKQLTTIKNLNAESVKNSLTTAKSIAGSNLVYQSSTAPGAITDRINQITTFNSQGESTSLSFQGYKRNDKNELFAHYETKNGKAQYMAVEGKDPAYRSWKPGAALSNSMTSNEAAVRVTASEIKSPDQSITRQSTVPSRKLLLQFRSR